MAEPDSGSAPAPDAPDSFSDAAPENEPQGQMDPALEAVLAELWSEWTQQRGPLSLARLCKRTGLRMSTLKRFLTLLEASDVVCLSTNARGVECASLTEAAAAGLAADSSP